MSTKMITEGIWAKLTKAAGAARQPCHVAVAYFSDGADRMLPLPDGSRLVVDASERAVSSGATCPSALSRLLENGIKVYSVPNLHAKVFVLGRAAYVGSANVSANSSTRLVEAILRSTDPKVISEAKKFVESLCLHELTPRLLEKLEGLYVPPKMPRGGQRTHTSDGNADIPEIPHLRIARLKDVKWSDWDQKNIEEGAPEAERRREHGKGYCLEYFKWAGRCAIQEGDIVVQILTEKDGRVFVSPPGNVVMTLNRRQGGKEVTYVHLERPDRHRRTLERVTRKIGDEFAGKLSRSGVVKNADCARALLKSWNG